MEHRRTSTDSLPQRLQVTPIGEKEYYFNDMDTYYYPDAWDKPGHILLKRRWRNFYYVIFGDGTDAALTHWHYRGGHPIPEPRYIQTTVAEKYGYGTLWVIPLGAVAVAATLALQRKADRKESPWDCG